MVVPMKHEESPADGLESRSPGPKTRQGLSGIVCLLCVASPPSPHAASGSSSRGRAARQAAQTPIGPRRRSRARCRRCKLPPIEKRTLSNGLQVWIVELHKVPIVHCHPRVEGGQRRRPAAASSASRA